MCVFLPNKYLSKSVWAISEPETLCNKFFLKILFVLAALVAVVAELIYLGIKLKISEL